MILNPTELAHLQRVTSQGICCDVKNYLRPLWPFISRAKRLLPLPPLSLLSLITETVPLVHTFLRHHWSQSPRTSKGERQGNPSGSVLCHQQGVQMQKNPEGWWVRWPVIRFLLHFWPKICYFDTKLNASVFLLILVSVISRSAFFLKFALTEDWPLLLSEG